MTGIVQSWKAFARESAKYFTFVKDKLVNTTEKTSFKLRHNTYYTVFT